MVDRGLRLLSLDGGGVRGLSSLLILQRLMMEAAEDNNKPPKPCDYFDMIGGTSTGGLIAIMLGRLRMTIEDCITAYCMLADKVFEKKSHRVTLNLRVIPASEGVKVDAKEGGFLVWVPTGDGGEDGDE